MKKLNIILILIALLIFSIGVQAENIIINNIGKMEGHTLCQLLPPNQRQD